MLLIIFALHTKIIFTPHQQQYCPPPNIRDLALPLIWIFLKLKSAFSLIFILPSCALTKRPTVEGGGGSQATKILPVFVDIIATFANYTFIILNPFMFKRTNSKHSTPYRNKPYFRILAIENMTTFFYDATFW